MRLIAILSAVCLLGCESDHEVAADLTFESDGFFSGGIEDIEFEINGTKYRGDWTIVDSFEGPLESMPDDYRGPDHEFSPILLSRESDKAPKLVTRVRSIAGTSKSRVLFLSDAQKPSEGHPLERRMIYFFDPTERQLHPLEKFDSFDTEMEIQEKAIAALRKRIEQGDDAN